MKIIDLLNKIANGEEAPKKVKYEEDIYIYDDEAREGKAYHTMIGKGRIYYLFEMVDYLNEEVEIIEDKPFNERVEEIYNRHIDYIYGKEDKKIEKMIKLNNISNPSDMTALCTMQWENNKIIEKKIDEIINYINEGDK